jgi:hypothetical protein
VLTFEIWLDAWRRLDRESASSIISQDRDALRASVRIQTGCG